jgi:hypothetical protein
MSLTVAGSALRLCKSTRPVTDAGEIQVPGSTSVLTQWYTGIDSSG